MKLYRNLFNTICCLLLIIAFLCSTIPAFAKKTDSTSIKSLDVEDDIKEYAAMVFPKHLHKWRNA